MAKGPQAFRTISEAADELGVPQHVLRFWETRFSFIRPMKRAGGRRFYRPQDIAVLAGVRALLHRDGLSIKAVQTLYKDQGAKALLAAAEALPSPPAPGEPDPPQHPPPIIAGADPGLDDLGPAPWEEPEPTEPDLFAPQPEPPRPPLDPSPATQSRPPESPPMSQPQNPLEPPRPRLNPVGRAKLAATLAGLEAIKARLDALLDRG